MSDLIRRSELIKIMNNKYIGLNDAVDLYHGGIFDCFKEIKLMIKKQPTAYDIDKVVEELEERENEAILKAPNTSDITNPEYQKWMMKSYGFKEAIEIVKRGGVADDVCEWKYSGNVFISCNYKRFTDLHSFEYCPYCGKKIKVVK